MAEGRQCGCYSEYLSLFGSIFEFVLSFYSRLYYNGRMAKKDSIDSLNEAQLRSLVESLMNQLSGQQDNINHLASELIIRDQAITARDQEITRRDHELRLQQQLLTWKETRIAQLSHEMAVLKRWKFGRSREGLSADQLSLLDETIDADLAGVELELDELREGIGEGLAGADDEKVARSPRQPRRAPLPAGLPRTDVHHEPQSTVCANAGCAAALERIGEDVSEKLDYTPGTFTVERHVRGKWVCRCCQTLVQAPVPAHIIDKGIPTAGLLAHVLVAKYADHLPLARQEHIFARAGVPIARSTLAQWVGQCGVQLQPVVDALREEVLAHRVLHADETPVQMLKPGAGKTHRAYLWAYATGQHERLKAVVYDFCESRAGANASEFLQHWRGALMVDDYAGYKQVLKSPGVTELGCLAHARRKFFDLHQAGGSAVATKALEYFDHIYSIERAVQERQGGQAERLWARQRHVAPVMQALHQWMLLQRQQVPDGTATAKALEYSLRRWQALTQFLQDGQLPLDNNHLERQIRPIAVGKHNWLFAGSLRAGQRAAAVMTLINSAKLNGLDGRQGVLAGHLL